MPGELTLYQNDPRWQNDLLGFATDANSTIGKFGCLLTSLAMTANALGADETPASLNEKMKAAQAFQGPWVRAHQIGAAVPGLRVANDTQIKLLPANAELLVIEAGNAATKIGANGQWLQVRDLQGTEGYVAAWFVRRA